MRPRVNVVTDEFGFEERRQAPVIDRRAPTETATAFRNGRQAVRILWRPVHFVILATIAYVAVSAFWVGTLTSGLGFSALVDRIEVVLHPVAVHFKGSGFYSTDYGRGGKRKGEGSKDGDSGSGEKTEKT